MPASAAVATTTQAGWQGADGRPAGLAGEHRWTWGRWKPPVMQPPVERRRVADEPRDPRPAGLPSARRLHHGGGITRLLHARGLVCRRLTDAPALPSLPAWHYHAAPSQAGRIGALIATRTPIPLTPARRR
jgi:hypothetical protein